MEVASISTADTTEWLTLVERERDVSQRWGGSRGTGDQRMSEHGGGLQRTGKPSQRTKGS